MKENQQCNELYGHMWWGEWGTGDWRLETGGKLGDGSRRGFSSGMDQPIL